MNKESMESIIARIRNGSADGENFWVCGYKQKGLEKRTKYVPPTLVKVVSNTTIKRTVHYSDSHFRAIKGNGDLAKKVIVLFDNTGWRSNPGTPLEVFTSKSACMQRWVALLHEGRENLTKERDTIVERLDSRIDNLDVEIAEAKQELSDDQLRESQQDWVDSDDSFIHG